MNIMHDRRARRQSNPNPPPQPASLETLESARQRRLQLGRWPPEKLSRFATLSPWRVRLLLEELR